MRKFCLTKKLHNYRELSWITISIWCCILNALLGWGLVFDNEIAAQKKSDQMHIRRNFTSRERSEAASNFWEAGVRAENGNEKRLSGYESGIKDRKRWTRKKKRGQEGWRAWGPWTIKRMEVPIPLLIRLLILLLHLHQHSLYLAAHFTHIFQSKALLRNL